MESILKELLQGVLTDCLQAPGEREKKRLKQLAAAGPAPGSDRAVVYGYGLSYVGLMLGAVWGAMLLPGATEASLYGYALCYMAGSLLLEILLWLYTLAVKRSGWQVLAACSIRRDAKGRVMCYYSARWRWFFRSWGIVFLLLSAAAG